MTLDELKDNYARERGWSDWGDLLNNCSATGLNEAINEICILAQKEALKNASVGITNENNLTK